VKFTNSQPLPGRVEKQLLAMVERSIAQYRMLVPGDAVLIAVSGGPDSMALLHLLLSLAPAFSLRLGVAHLNHGLREKAGDREAAFVTEAASALGLPCYVKSVDVAAYRQRRRINLEEASRRIRYRFFAQTAAENGYAKVAVGHQADDNAELMLMNLLRGSGPNGLSGIPPRRRLSESSGSRGEDAAGVTVCRPLIALSREDILAYLSERAVTYVSDESNTDPAYRRNRIRHQLIPHLAKVYNPKIVAALNRLATIVRSETEWAEGVAAGLLAKLTRPAPPGGGVSLAADAMRGLHPALCRRVLRQAVAAAKGDLRRITFDHVTAIRALLDHAKPGARLDLPGGLQAARESGALVIRKPSAVPREAPFSYKVSKPADRPLWLHIAETGDRLCFERAGHPDMSQIRAAGHRIAFLDMDRLQFPLVVRNFRPGDRFIPLGLQGSKKVKKYFIDEGVPKSRRRQCPLLTSGGEIVWIAGYRVGAIAQIDDGTRQILKVELFLA
jgi:tRNA(Ile)-lysidine synthase